MSVYCYVCCDYCKHHEKCDSRNGGCEKCDYWKYGECTNPAEADERLLQPSRLNSKVPSQ